MDKKLGNIWKLMEDFNFKFDRKLPTDLICVLCKNILIDARISSCGCRFCKKCIEEYLISGDLICPGSSDECGEEMLNLETSVTIDHFINRKISKMKVPCPIEVCPFVEQIMNMEEHLTVCRSHAVKCSYSEYGCKYASLEAGNISSHLNTNKDDHIESMVMTIKNLENQCAKLLTENQVLSSENNSMREESVKTKVNTENSKTLTDDLRRQLVVKDQSLSTTKSDLAYQLQMLRSQLNSKTTEVLTLTNKCESQLNEINLLKCDLNAHYNEHIIPFEWHISNYSLMSRGICLYSDEFIVHVNGTKLQLNCRYDSSYKSYKIHTMLSHGSLNTLDKRPVRCSITIGIVDPKTGQYFFSSKELFTYSKINDQSNGLKFVESDFSSNLNSSSQVTIKCLVKIIY